MASIKDKVLIRKIKGSDYDNFLALINGFRPTTFTREDFIAALKRMNKNTEIWVIEHEGKLIGSASLVIEQKFIHNMAKLGHIEEMTIKEEFRHQGLGKMIIEKIIQRARENGCYKITLNCTEDMKHFYEVCGLEKAGIQMIERFDL